MNGKNGGLLGRITALALILGVAYGVRSIARGGMGCPMSGSSCCMPGARHDEAVSAPSVDDKLGDPDAPKNIPAAK